MKKTIDYIKKMSYTDFISFIKEENRPSGGKKTIREIAQNAFITDKKKVLEIGSTNGFSSIEISRITNCKAYGIDINPNSVKNANEKVKEYGLLCKNIFFMEASAEEIPYGKEEFDLIMCGNALSFVNNKIEALVEIKRVLKKSGFISIVPIWYKNTPNTEITKKVSEVLGFEIKCTYEKDWVDFAFNNNLEIYYKKDYNFIKKTKKEIKEYVNKFVDSKKHLKNYNKEEIDYIKKRWYNTMKTFHDNLIQTKYSVILLRKNSILEEIELFETF